MPSAPEPLTRELLDSGSLHPSNAGAFDRLDRPGRECLAVVLRAGKISLQTQRELIEWLPEIACAEGIETARVLDCPETETLLAPGTANRPQAIEKLRRAMHARRFPQLTRIRGAWERDARRINPDPGHIRFIPPEAFEHDGLEIRIAVTNDHEAMSAIAGLAAVSPADWRKLARPAAPGGA